MRKILWLIALIMCCINPIYAKESTDLSYTVDQSYEWEIHTSINFGSNAGANQQIQKQATLSDETLYGVRVNKNIISDGSILVISIDEGVNMNLVSNGVSLPYTVRKTQEGETLSSGCSVLEVPAGVNTASQPLFFTLHTTTDPAEIAGSYEGNISYSASLQTITNNQKLLVLYESNDMYIIRNIDNIWTITVSNRTLETTNVIIDSLTSELLEIEAVEQSASDLLYTKITKEENIYSLYFNENDGDYYYFSSLTTENPSTISFESLNAGDTIPGTNLGLIGIIQEDELINDFDLSFMDDGTYLLIIEDVISEGYYFATNLYDQDYNYIGFVEIRDYDDDYIFA